MEDHFYDPGSEGQQNPAHSIVSKSLNILFTPSPASLITLALAPLLILLMLRVTSECVPRAVGRGRERIIWRLPYWVPFIGHGFQILKDPQMLLRIGREDEDGIFELNLGGKSHIIVHEKSLVKRSVNMAERVMDHINLNSALTLRTSQVEFHAPAWGFASKMFGLTAKAKWDKMWDEFISLLHILIREPGLSAVLNPTMEFLTTNIPQMVSFVDTEVDLQPWERSAKAVYVSPDEVEVDLLVLIRDMLSHASISAMFGKGLLEKYPNLIEDVFTMDQGITFFLLGLPPLTPWPGVFKAHMARRRLWEALDEQQRQLDKKATGEETDYSWGDLDDVSMLIQERHRLYRENGFAVKERGDLSILWALVINAPDLAAFLTFHIFSTPGLVSQIRAELSKHVKIAPGTTIGKFSSPPTLEISHQGLATQSPLFKSAYQEALRLYSAPWSVRAVKQDAIISNGKGGPEYRLHKGNNIILPHEVHMLNPRHFPQPEQFIADRFLKPDSSDEGEGEGKKDVGQDVFDPGMIRPYGGGMSMCKGRTYAEREILSIVAGVVMMWDFEPVVNEKGRKEWKLPLVERASGVAKPRGEVRVRIKKRGFEREEN